MEIKVYDWQGQERDLAYLRGKYGDFIIKEATPNEGQAYKIAVLREKAAGMFRGQPVHPEPGVFESSALVVHVMDGNGQPLDDVPVAWYWPDAPQDENAGPFGGVLPEMKPNRAFKGFTNANGDVGFGMGGGAFYWPDKGEIGPHAAWIYGAQTGSDLILGLGMVAGTDHYHFDVEFMLVETPEPPPGDCPREEVLASVGIIEIELARIRSLMEV